MCGRIVQKNNRDDYLETLIRAPRAGELFPPDPVGPRYNIPPGTRPLTLHEFQDGTIQVERIFWGYKPQNWARKPISNAKIETIAAGRWPWNWLMKEGGRIIVPANGWYEWKWLTDDPKGPKQPYYIHHANDEPLFFAAVTAWRPGREHGKDNGMAIVTNDARGGMVDVHDRRPVALAPLPAHRTARLGDAGHRAARPRDRRIGAQYCHGQPGHDARRRRFHARPAQGAGRA